MEIGAFEARDKFSRLLDRVQLGEEIVITRRGRAIAKLVPGTGAADSSLTAAGSQRKPVPAATSNSH